MFKNSETDDKNYAKKPDSSFESFSSKVLEELDYKKVFKKFDLNQDKSLSSTELGALYTFNYFELYGQKIDKSFSQAAKNGVIEEKDFNKDDFYVAPNSTFSDMDCNNDHNLSKEEVFKTNAVRNRYGPTERVANAKINFDGNNDLKIDETEFRELWNQPGFNRNEASQSSRLDKVEVQVMTVIYDQIVKYSQSNKS